MSREVKVVFEAEGEMRRYILASGNRPYQELMEKIQSVFGVDVPRSEILIFWKDSEGDLVSCSSDSELQTAMEYSTNQNELLKLYVRIAPPPPPYSSLGAKNEGINKASPDVKTQHEEAKNEKDNEHEQEHGCCNTAGTWINMNCGRGRGCSTAGPTFRGFHRFPNMRTGFRPPFGPRGAGGQCRAWARAQAGGWATSAGGSSSSFQQHSYSQSNQEKPK